MEEYVQCLDRGNDMYVYLFILNMSGSGSGVSDGVFFRVVFCVRRSVENWYKVVSIIFDQL